LGIIVKYDGCHGEKGAGAANESNEKPLLNLIWERFPQVRFGTDQLAFIIAQVFNVI